MEIKILKDLYTGEKLIEIKDLKKILNEVKNRACHAIEIEEAKKMEGIDFQKIEKVEIIIDDLINNIMEQIEEIKN